MTAPKPERKTWKGHGRPAQVRYYGYGALPRTQGRIARVALVRHDDGHLPYTTVDVTWELTNGEDHTMQLPPALAFWAVPL